MYLEDDDDDDDDDRETDMDNGPALKNLATLMDPTVVQKLLQKHFSKSPQ